MVVKVLRDNDALELLNKCKCLECDGELDFCGTGQAGLQRVYCYTCGKCDILYQLLVEKHGEPMFVEAKEKGRCALVADKEQRKCNLCACGLYARSDQVD